MPLRELSPQQSTGPNQPRGWLSKQCVRKLGEFQQRGETVNRSLLGVLKGGPGRVSRVERTRRGLAVRSGDLRAVRLPLQLVRWLTCSASELKRNCDQHDKSKDQERHQGSHCQSGTIASDQFRHFSPPSSPAKRRRSGGSSPRAAPALPKPGGIDTPGPAQPSFNARTLSRIEEKLARVCGRSPRAARRRGEAECATTPGLAKRTDCVRAHWLMEQRAARWRVILTGTPGCSCSPPQDSEDSQERPPKRVGGLVRDDSEDDADHDTDQRDEISDAQSHVASPLRRRPGN